MIAWQRIQSGELDDRQLHALRLLGAHQPAKILDLHIAGGDYLQPWTLRDLAGGGLVEMYNTLDGRVLRAAVIEEAWYGRWAGVSLRLTAAGETRLAAGR